MMRSFPAGLSVATECADLDVETYSAAGNLWDDLRERWVPPNGAKTRGLSAVGAAAYAEHESFEVLCFAYDLKRGEGRKRWRQGQGAPSDLLAHLAAGEPIEAWNAGFECWAWAQYFVSKLGWPAVPDNQWRCAMAKARAHSLPGKLDETARVLGLAERKQSDGKSLIEKFTLPRQPTKLDTALRCALLPEPLAVTGVRAADKVASETHAATLRFFDYNETDIVVEAAASRRIPDLSSLELAYWQDDQRINRRGVRIDLESVHAAISIVEQVERRYGEELQALAGCLPTELGQLKAWLESQGLQVHSLDADTLDGLLSPSRELSPEVRRALEIRQSAGLSSVKKLYAMRNQATRAGRLHDLYSYHGAHTGRPTGQGPQPTNLPKAGPATYRCGFALVGGLEMPLPGGGCGRFHGTHTTWCPWCWRHTSRVEADVREWSPGAAEDALQAISFRSLDFVELVFGSALLTVAGVLRALFIASPGNELVSSDFTAIEGVVIAALAGEQWRLDVFAANGSIYVESAARAFGVPVSDMLEYRKRTGQHHPLRDKGKRMELGLGFGGWINALRSPNIDYRGTDDELKSAILAWRAASPALEHFWGGQKGGPGQTDRWAPRMFGLEGAAVTSVLSPGTWNDVTRLDGTSTGVAFITWEDALYCRLPSGRHITYHRPRLVAAQDAWRGLAMSYEGWNSNPLQGPVGWTRKNTYGAKFAENVTQAVARDIQMAAIRRCERDGHAVVLHTYDEIVCDVPVGSLTVPALETLMVAPEAWRVGWPVKADGGWVGSRYRKG
jgi:DNA polymerase bacteriophage-type